jgi:lipopolysaccharide assembly protein A
MSSQQEPRPSAGNPPESVPQGPQEAGNAVEPAVDPAAPAAQPVSVPDQQQPERDRVPHTRVGTIWIGIGAAALIMIALIVFLLQNTTTVEVAFLGFEGSLPLAVALLIAWVTGVLLTLIVGTARIAQLRRLNRHRRGKTKR